MFVSEMIKSRDVLDVEQIWGFCSGLCAVLPHPFLHGPFCCAQGMPFVPARPGALMRCALCPSFGWVPVQTCLASHFLSDVCCLSPYHPAGIASLLAPSSLAAASLGTCHRLTHRATSLPSQTAGCKDSISGQCWPAVRPQ